MLLVTSYINKSNSFSVHRRLSFNCMNRDAQTTIRNGNTRYFDANDNLKVKLKSTVNDTNNTETEIKSKINIVTDELEVIDEVQEAVASLASTTLALLAGNKESAQVLAGNASSKREVINTVFAAHDIDGNGMLNKHEAKSLFQRLSRSIVQELAKDDNDSPASRAHALRVLADDEAGNTIERVATKLLLLADDDDDGLVSLTELAGLFDVVHKATTPSGNAIETFPQPLRALAGSLQLLPKTEGVQISDYDHSKASEWNLGVPGDDHTLRCVKLEDGLSVVGLGRSADASAYFLPELGIVFDAGIQVKSLTPKTVLLTHGHRDHIAALPTMAAQKTAIYAPKPISNLLNKFLLAEAQLNYGDQYQTDEETTNALGAFDIRPVVDCDDIPLEKSRYTGSPTPIGIQVFEAPHKDGVPAVSYGIYRQKTRLKKEYASLPKNELGELFRNKNSNITITESYKEELIFYTGDTKIELLRTRYKEILPLYKYIIHEVTFLGEPSTTLDMSAEKKGHTHYAQLHPWICAFPETTFICVHWSLRYSRQDVLNFFNDQYGGVPKNVVLWV